MKKKYAPRFELKDSLERDIELLEGSEQTKMVQRKLKKLRGLMHEIEVAEPLQDEVLKGVHD